MRDSFLLPATYTQNKSHREEAILVKDLVRDALRKAERQRHHAALLRLEKVLTFAEGLHGNHSRGKAIFLPVASRGIWRELDFRPRPDKSQIACELAFPSTPSWWTQIPDCRAHALRW